MITQTYICDMCNKSVGANELHPISIDIKIHGGNSYGRSLGTKAQDVCKSCLEKKGILIVTAANEKQEEKRLVNEKTFEAKFIDLLEDLGVQFQE